VVRSRVLIDYPIVFRTSDTNREDAVAEHGIVVFKFQVDKTFN
jgi:hypothetical protein